MDPSPQPINILSLCSGIGGLDSGVHRALQKIGFSPRTVCMVERESFACGFLVSQMERGSLDPCPIWTDLLTFDPSPWVGLVDLVVAGVPCQPVSVAGKRKGEKDERWLWPYVRDLLIQLHHPMFFLENVPGLIQRGLRGILRDLSGLGYQVGGRGQTRSWGVYSAEEFGAPHKRERVFLLANTNGLQSKRWRGSSPVVREESKGQEEGGEREWYGDTPRRCGEGYPAGSNAPSFQSREMGLFHLPGLEGRRISQDPGERILRPSGPAVVDPHRRNLKGPRHDRKHGEEIPHEEREPHRTSCILPPFPPRPNDWESWIRVIAKRPDLEPSLCRVVDGSEDRIDRTRVMGNRVDRIRALGNAVVPSQAERAFIDLWRRAQNPVDRKDQLHPIKKPEGFGAF